nr:YeeE/YedE thiosulfate transporter family protein [Sphingomicrobium nitratireducens]
MAAFPGADPVGGLLGGLLIGLAGALMLLGAGRIAGVSGIFARATGIGTGSMDRTAAWAFVLGLPLGALLLGLAVAKEPPSFFDWPYLVVAGLLVGFGTRLGNGCTSGHGVCGVSRLSGRSIVATLTFMAAGIATVALMNMMGVGQ